MNRFRRHKKVKEVKEVKDTPPEPESGPSAPTFMGLKKKDVPEPKPVLDLSSALPSSDDFRTSLLMPKLSARFSMLREQDDPESKLGKASDDSVLFPKRASRLNLFGHTPNMLADIDEVSSNDGSRPSIALGRSDSYASGGDAYGTDDDHAHNDSIMSRARRVEGNNLFGGRQKIYKIPETGRQGMGKAVYEHDLNLSAFQRLRQKDREERAAEEAARDGFAQELEDSRSTISSTKRTTYSSTASGAPPYARTSTAATSIDESHFAATHSQTPSGSTPEPQVDAARPPSAMAAPKNTSIRSRRLYGQGLVQAAQNQQSSTLYRLENLGRQRSGTPETAPLNRNFSKSASNLRDRLQKLATNGPTSTSRPTSPPSSATSPNRPTSTETSSKERISPTAATFGNARPLSPTSSENEERAALAAALQPEDRGKATALGLFNKPAMAFDEEQFSRRQLQMFQGRNTPPLRRMSPPRRPPPPEPVGRPRGLSKSSFRSRAESSASSHYSSDAQRGADYSRTSSVEASPRQPGAAVFYANSTASESGEEGEARRYFEEYSTSSIATDHSHSIHPASTAATGDHLETLPETRFSDLGELKPIEETDVSGSDEDGATTRERLDPPTLQQPGLGLKKLVRSHLRHDSDKSLYPPSPLLPLHMEHPTVSRSATQQSFDQQSAGPPTASDETNPPPVVQRGTLDSHSATGPSPGGTFYRDSEDSFEMRASLEDHRAADEESWRKDLAFEHRRDGSTGTQKEREEFARELAERRRKVQEKLRSVAEADSRSASPGSDRQTSEPTQPRAGNAFSLLKHKSSKQGLKSEQKMNMPGSGNASTPALVSEDSWREEEQRSFSIGRRSNSSSPQVGERSVRSRMPTLSRGSSQEPRESSRSRGPSPAGSRIYSGSDASGRSKSRTRYREDLEPVEEGTVIAHENFLPPDNYEHPAPASGPAWTHPVSNLGPERPSQLSQPSNPTSMIGASPRPSPEAPPYSANATPPLYDLSPNESVGSASSVSGGPSPPQRAPGHPFLQKRAVSKKQISEPTFLSCTSNVPTVGLPSGASQSQGNTPPVPPMNPRRRRGTATQTILGALKGDKSDKSDKTDKTDSQSASSTTPSVTDEHSVFADDEKRPRNRLHKTSSEGGSLHAREHQEAIAGPPPAVPQHPPPPVPVNGGMF